MSAAWLVTQIIWVVCRASFGSSRICMYVCMVITYSRVWINRVRLPILIVASWTGKMNIPLSPCVPEIWSRETGSAAPSRVSLLISILRLNLVLTYGIPPEFRGGVHLWNRHTPSGQSRVYRVTQLRTDGVSCRDSAGTGPVDLKVVPNGCYALADHHGPINIRLSFSHPQLVWSGYAESTGGIIPWLVLENTELKSWSYVGQTFLLCIWPLVNRTWWIDSLIRLVTNFR